MSDSESPAVHLAALQQILERMPPVAAMQIQVAGYAGGVLSLRAPLAANVNDKGNAFGGSLSSVMTLSGWALVTLRLRLAGFDADVYVADSHVRYLAPVYEDLQAQAQAADEADWAVFLSTFAQRGKARIDVVARQPGDAGKPAAELSGRFVAFARR
ncbi:YiiD C-terminal domain-containing protein [uncultured Stenotrophomonas sp.]|uniref:YiiD C-terminal domain-containing protein n=1 Tax=uncultured Stenotrophomonas sp. TaxID=165438 RepID=UPI0028E8A16D|nr:YiiD C-terminal domain-containing protein [uncultured Stenotrophomonas sp.]